MPSRATAGVLGILVAALVAVGTYFGAWRGGSEGPGYLAVVHGCGILTMRSDGTEWRFNCLPGIWAAVSVSDDGKTLAWDTSTGGLSAIVVADADTENQHSLSLPPGANFEPSLSPDGDKLAFLHSPRDDGRYDIWTTSTSIANAEQVTTSHDVSSVAWSPAGDWIAYVKGWSAETLEGDIGLIRPDTSDERRLGRGDVPVWAPDGGRLAFVRDSSVWTIDVDGGGEQLLARDAHAPAWSRDGRLVAFMREDRCDKPVCPDHAFLVSADGGTPKLVGPSFPEERRLLWVTSKSVSKG